MKQICILLLLSFTMFSCSKDDEVVDNSTINFIEPILAAQDANFQPLFEKAPDFFTAKDYVIKHVREYDNKIYIVTSVGVGISKDAGESYQFKKIKGLSTSEIKNLYFHQTGLYICTDRGIIIADFDLTTFKAVANGDNYLGGTVNNIEIYDGVVYLATQNGAFTTDLEFNEFTQLVLNKKQPNIRVTDIKALKPQDKKLHIFASSDTGLFVSKNAGKSFHQITSENSKIPNNNIGSLTLSASTLYLATPQGLLITSDLAESFIVKTTKDNLPSNHINKVIVSENGDLLVTTQNGLAVSNNNGKTFRPYSTLSGLPAKGIHEVIYSKLSSKTMIASDQGLITTDDLNSYRYQLSKINSLLTDQLNVTAIFALDEKNILFGTRLGLLTTRDGGKSIARKTNSLDVSDEEITDIYQHMKSVFIATPIGVGKSTNQVEFPAVVKGYPVHQIKTFKDSIVLATDDGIAFSSGNDQNFLVSGSEEGLPKTGINRLWVYTRSFSNVSEENRSDLEDYMDIPKIFAATSQGLYYSFGPNQFSLISKDIIPNENITDIFVDSNVIYVTTQKALYLSVDHGETFTEKKIISDTSPSTINRIAATQKHIIVASTDGIYVSDDAGKTFVKKIIPNIKNIKLFSLDIRSVYILKLKKSFIVYLGTTNNIFKSENISYEE